MDHRLYWTSTKIAARLALIRPLIHRERVPLEPFRYRTLPDADAPPPIGDDVDDSDWETIEPHSYWGEQTTNFCFRTAFHVPDDWPERPLALHLPMGKAGDIFTHPEALLHVDGRAIASADRHHHLIRLDAQLRDGARHRVALHGWTGLAGWPPDPSLRTKLFMEACALVQIDEPTEAFVALAELALGAANELSDERPERHRLFNALDAAFLALDTRDPLRTSRFWNSVPRAHEVLRQGIADAGAPLDVDIVAVGHAHMDIAYLWQVSQMRRKNARTYSNVLRLMDANPAYRYSHNQPQLYRYTEEDYPEIFARIRERVADGRWEPMGGMWVEADTNITGAESLVRQLTLGRRYFADAFGDSLETRRAAARAAGEPVPDSVDTPVLWLPDTFGFTWSLPQLMKQAGLKWFLTSKVNWNQYNPMPAQNFLWQGIDGTRVPTHLLTTPRPVQHLPFPTTYKAEVTPAEVHGSWTNFRQKDSGRELMMVYGYGDGGGGPTEDLVRKAGLLGDMPGMPRVRMGTVREFFENLEDAGLGKLPVWNDEIYMEGHRGVLTTHGDVKRANRRAERLLHRVELVATLAAETVGHVYPHTELRRLWELLCLNQFHDVLPGTSIPEVFADAHRDWDEITRTGRALFDDALDALAFGLDDASGLFRINTSPATDEGVVRFDDLAWLDRVMALGETEVGADETSERAAVVARAVPPAVAATGVGVRPLGGGARLEVRAPRTPSSDGTAPPLAPTPAPAPTPASSDGHAKRGEPGARAYRDGTSRNRADEANRAGSTGDTSGPGIVARDGRAPDELDAPSAGTPDGPAADERACAPGDVCRATCDACRRRARARLVDTRTGRAVRSQVVADGLLLSLMPAPAGSLSTLRLRHDASAVGTRRVRTPSDAVASESSTGYTLENACLRVEFDPEGRLVRVFDRETRREVLAPDAHGNVLQAFEDRPLNWDAWDIDAFYEERAETVEGLVRIDAVESGPLRAALRIERRYGASHIVQHVRLALDSRRIDFVTDVDWHETHTLLKVAFPVSILAPRATYEIQWGSIERPTHRNTSWDFAKFEVAAQQWADLSEGGYGVALLNDCKYGYDIRDNVMRLSLIKSATSPDPTSDQGPHRFTYALMPHAGNWRDGVVAEARRLNDPTVVARVHDRRTDGVHRLAREAFDAERRAATGTRAPAPGVLPRGPFRLVASESRNAVVETVKQAEDGRGFVVRLYEAERRRGTVHLRFGVPVRRVVRCDLLENDAEELVVANGAVAFELAPFEIASLRVVTGAGDG